MKKKIAWAVAQTEVTELLDKPIHFLSVGQKKTCGNGRCISDGTGCPFIR
ncbi:hypothetical protein OL548_25755 [Lysinibacillus sp. MHQ-1]|nr:hypothetical protein OL548_25755 [Lysinibacillus sp. MHQ-1]